jgi:hypothetical protein
MRPTESLKVFAGYRSGEVAVSDREPQFVFQVSECIADDRVA